jgi:hypothetical protein
LDAARTNLAEARALLSVDKPSVEDMKEALKQSECVSELSEAPDLNVQPPKYDESPFMKERNRINKEHACEVGLELVDWLRWNVPGINFTFEIIDNATGFGFGCEKSYDISLTFTYMTKDFTVHKETQDFSLLLLIKDRPDTVARLVGRAVRARVADMDKQIRV